MRVHITGCNGFIAGHLRRHLGTKAGLGLTDSDFAFDPEGALHDSNIDVVIHAGAQVGREFGELDPHHTVNMNAASTTLWARECARLGIHFLYLSTSEAYGDMHGLDADEYGEMNLPYNLYGLTKRWGEEAARLYCDPDLLTIVRLSMPYGPGLPPGRGRAALINFLWNAMHDEPIPVHVGASRSWCYVGDSIEAVCMLALERHAGIYNVGRDDNEMDMNDVAHLACRLVAEAEDRDLERMLALIRGVPAPENQVLVKRLPTDRVRALGWEPVVELRQGMAATYQWLRHSYDPTKHPTPVLP